MFELLISQALNGLVTGMSLVLVSIGLSIIFGMLRIINFAHGVFYAVGVYVAFSITLATGNFFLGLVGSAVITAILGVIVEVGLLRPLYGEDPHYHLLLLFGLALIFEEGIAIIWGLEGHTTNAPALLQGTVDLGVTKMALYRLFLIAVTAIMVLLIWLFLRATKYGAIIRAGVEWPEMVECLGINIRKLFTIGFGAGVAMAAIAGTLMTPLITIEPLMGNSILVESFVVVVLGGLGNFRGALFGGLFVGLVMNLTAIVSPEFSNTVIFVFMVAFLLLKPEGLFGGKGVV
jgi:branched-chain amino acid transport system permease protein